MKQTSFGQMDQILTLNNQVTSEYLVFEKEGRKHKHLEYESFVVLSGEGQVICGDQSYDVLPGDIVTIPPKTDHWMIPSKGKVLTGLLWYHSQVGNRHLGTHSN